MGIAWQNTAYNQPPHLGYFLKDYIDGKLDTGIEGDVNGDGTVDVADVSSIISVMAGETDNDYDADVNGDGTVDVADISTVISIMAES